MRLNIKSIWRLLFLSTAMLFALCSSTWAQDIVVKGTVTDGESGEPLPGVNVVIVGSQSGTITNVEGLYEITMSSDQTTLSFTFVGYNTQTLDVAGQTTLNVQLMPELTSLDEVVVVGYGTMKKKDLTGAVSSVKKKDIAANRTSDALGLLQGKVAGLDLTQTSGQTGSEVNLTMRGTRSLNAGNSPLVIVDGIEYGAPSFDDKGIEQGFPLDINSSDIQSIDVLKDAASTAIYGTRGANGVIIITTKSGGDGNVKVSYNTYASYNSPAFNMHIQNGAEYAQKYIDKAVGDEENGMFYNQGVEYNLLTGEVTWDQAAYPNPTNMFGTVTVEDLVAKRGLNNQYELVTTDPTAVQRMLDGVSLDYLDMIMVDSWSQNHEISITGGDEKTAFNISAGYLDDHGLIRKDQLSRYNVKLGVDHKLGKSVKIGTDLLFTKKYRFKRNPGIFNQATKCGPIGVLYNEDGTYNEKPDGIMEYNQLNPMLDEVEGAFVDDVFEDRLFGSAYLNWDIIPGLTFRSSLGTDFTYYKEGIYQGTKSLNKASTGKSEAEIYHRELQKYTWDNVLSYQKTIGTDHSINLMVGSSAYVNQATASHMYGFEQPLDQTAWYDFNGTDKLVAETDFTKWQMLSYFGRVNYSLKSKYLFQATIRADGASVLDPDNRWASFPSASVGWRVSEEDFMQGVSFVDNLKVRYSWGIAGNAAIQPYQSLTVLGNVPNYYSFGSTTFQQYVPYQPGNKDLTWEKTASHNVGLDFSIINNRIFGSVDYYKSETTDLLFQVPLPSSSGFPVTFANVASTANEGFEATLTTVNIDMKNFEWSTDWTYARNLSTITALNSGVTELGHYQTRGGGFDWDNAAMLWRVGSPTNSFFTYEVDGMYSVQDLQDEFDYIAQQHASGDSIEKGRIPMISHKFYPGSVKLVDRNMDGEYTDEDKILLDADPQFIFSISNSFTLKTGIGNFGLDVHAIARIGQHIAYGTYFRYKSPTDWVNGPYVEAWTPTNTDAPFPRWSSYGNATQSTFTGPLVYQNTSFIKIKDITLSYSMPASLLDKLPIEGVRVYVSARNMRSLVFSNLPNYDPENDGAIDWPLAQQIFFGLNLDF